MNSFEQWVHNQNQADSEVGKSRRSKILGRVVLPLAATALTSLAIFNVAEAGPDLHPYDLSLVHREYTARPGDTIFGIAERAEPNQDPREVSADITDTLEVLNHVGRNQAEVLQPGEVIPLPADAAIGRLVIPSQPSH